MKTLGVVRTLGLVALASAGLSNSAHAQTCESLFVSLTRAESKAEQARLKEAGKFLRTNLRTPDTDASELIANSDLGEVIRPLTVKEIVAADPQSAEVARNKILNAYVAVTKSLGRTAEPRELAEALELKVEELDRLMGPGSLYQDMRALRDAAMKKKPKAFDRVIDTTIFTAERTENLVKAIKDRSRLIVTTAVAGSPVNKDFLASLLRAAKEMDAEILIFPSNMQTSGLDPILLDTPGVHIITNSIQLTPNLALNNIKITAKQINPLMGLNRLGPRGQSQIVGSPKLHSRTVPTIDNEINPHFLMTTGAVTDPIYNGKLYIQERTNAIAAQDHVMGALILEKTQGSIETALPGDPGLSGFFHFRHVEYVPKMKGFTDINKFYRADGVVNSDILALALPDVHVGVTDPNFVQSLRTIIKTLRPRRIALHDLFNGHSVSHHERSKLINNAMKYKQGTLDLEAELKSVVVFLNSVLSMDPKLELRIVLSNHDLWLNRWLNDGAFMNEPHNRAIGLELAAAMVRGESPLEYALNKYGLEYPKRVVLLQSGSWKEAGVEMGQHGHVGANGAKGSLNSMAIATDRSVFGHTHTNQRTRHSVNIGTATELRQDYNRDGASSWSHSFAAISSNGEIQVFVLRFGEWWRTSAPDSKHFFVRDFPVVEPNNDPSIGQQVDQYSNFQ